MAKTYLLFYNKSDGGQLEKEAFSTLREAVLDLAYELSNPEMFSATLLQVDETSKEVMMQFDKEGLHHVDMIGTVEVLGTHKYIGASHG